MTAERRYVWDVPVRLFHWAIVVLLGFSWWCAESERMDWHYKSGLTLCALVLFRIVWGFAGSTTARFADFVRGPRAVWDQFRQRGKPRTEPFGHSPIGGWSVLALITLLVVQIGTGLFAVDLDGLESGPLSYLVDFDQGRLAADLHEISFNVLLAISAIHVLAILFYRLAWRRDLLGPMISGYRKDSREEQDTIRAPWWRLVLAVALALAVTWTISIGLRF